MRVYLSDDENIFLATDTADAFTNPKVGYKQKRDSIGRGIKIRFLSDPLQPKDEPAKVYVGECDARR